MEQLDNFYGYFDVLLGTIFILIGFKIYNHSKEKKVKINLKK